MDERELRDRANEVRDWFMGIEKALNDLVTQDRNADERAKTQARVHADGYQKIATALERGLDRGFRHLADAIRANR